MVRQKHTEDEMNMMMQDEWQKIMTTLDEKGVQITKKNVTIKKNEKNWVLNARLQLEESAVRLVPTSTEPVMSEEADSEADSQNGGSPDGAQQENPSGGENAAQGEIVD